MKKKRIVGVTLVVVGVLVGAALFAATRDTGPPLLTRDTDVTARTFDAKRLLVASDADMAATAYVDGVLDRIQGTQDALSLITLADLSTPVSASAANSVAAWPGTLDVSPDGNAAYVVETFGSVPANVDTIESTHTGFLPGHLLTTIDISGAAPRVVRTDDVGTNPTSVHCASDGKWLAIATTDDATPLTFVLLDRGIPTELRRPMLTLPAVARPAGTSGLSYARLSPDGRTIALHIASTWVVFGEIVFDAQNLPSSVRLGAPIKAGKYISVGRWSPEGRYYIVADTDWGPDPGDSLRAGPGRLVAIDVHARTIASSASVSFGPEGFDVNRAGDLFVVVNMERTYAPERLPYSLIPRHLQASLSLVAFDTMSGALQTVDGPLAFDGMLPEDAVFDRDGDLIAVAIFQDRKDAPKDGWVEFFSVERSGAVPRLSRTGKRIRMPRGVHDLAVAY
jgi:hypothetical protein